MEYIKQISIRIHQFLFILCIWCTLYGCHLNNDGRAKNDGCAWTFMIIGAICFCNIKHGQFIALVGIILFLIGCN